MLGRRIARLGPAPPPRCQSAVEGGRLPAVLAGAADWQRGGGCEAKVAWEVVRLAVLLPPSLLLYPLAPAESLAEEEAASMRRWMVLFQWFLIELSVRPGKCLEISAQRLPSCPWRETSIWSSSLVKGVLRMDGSR